VLLATGLALGGEPARGRVVGRASLCLPEVRSRVCVDTWGGAASGGSFSNDGNPLGWLARRRIASGHGFESNQTDILVSEYPFPKGRGWF
jgi:hypothetical protein